MAIDLDALRAKHAELTKAAGGGNSNDFLNNFYQVQEGTNVIRILPSASEDKEFYAETKIHRVPDNEGNIRNHHCMRHQGENCPLCDTYFALWKTKRKEDEDTARQIKPRSRYYMNVVDRESGEVRILSIGVILFQKIIGAMLDEDYGDITDPENGHDFKIIKVMDGKWPKYDQSQPRPKPSPTGSKKEVAEWMESLHDIYALVKKEDYADLKKVAECVMPSTQGSPVPEDTSEDVSDNDYLSKLKS
jgi:hypothetical protein|tara:strand:- start:488 stop:1228 length:741 start_codon:yes stop_codon:yes gene_type:complete